MENEKKTVDCTGDVVVGDLIEFEECVFSKRKNAELIGHRKIEAEVLKDSYGNDKQQHTFTLKLLDVSGYDELSLRAMAEKQKGNIRRKARNVYRNGTLRKLWADETERDIALSEKHDRGDEARTIRDARSHSSW